MAYARISVLSLFAMALRKFFSDNGLFLASGLAFNLLLYLVPLSLLMISLLGYTVLDSERALNEVQSALRAFLPRSQQALADSLATVVANRGPLGLFGFFAFVLFSSFLFSSVRGVLSRVFQVQQERTLLRGMGVDLLMMGLTALLLLLAVGATWFLAVAGALAERYLSWSGLPQPGLVALSRVIGVAVPVLSFYVLYRCSPAEAVSSRALLVASVTGTFLLQLVRWGFAWYVSLAQENIGLYGVLGGLMFLFLWLYYVSVVFILGAEVGWAYDRQRAGPSL